MKKFDQSKHLSDEQMHQIVNDAAIAKVPDGFHSRIMDYVEKNATQKTENRSKSWNSLPLKLTTSFVIVAICGAYLMSWLIPQLSHVKRAQLNDVKSGDSIQYILEDKNLDKSKDQTKGLTYGPTVPKTEYGYSDSKGLNTPAVPSKPTSLPEGTSPPARFGDTATLPAVEMFTMDYMGSSVIMLLTKQSFDEVIQIANVNGFSSRVIPATPMTGLSDPTYSQHPTLQILLGRDVGQRKAIIDAFAQGRQYADNGEAEFLLICTFS